MSDEAGQVLAVRQMAGEGRRGVERHHHRTGLQLRRDFVREPADQRIGDRENDDIDVVESGVDIDALDAEFVYQARPAASTRFDVADAEIRLQQVL